MSREGSGGDKQIERASFAIAARTNGAPWLICRKWRAAWPLSAIVPIACRSTGKGDAKYQAFNHTCEACPAKPKCCPRADCPKITREEHENASDVARTIRKTAQYKVSSLPPPKTIGNWPRSFLRRSKREEPEKKVAQTLFRELRSAHATLCFFNRIASFETFAAICGKVRYGTLSNFGSVFDLKVTVVRRATLA